MRAVTWNIKRAGKESEVWKILTDLNPDVILLQEVADLPDTLHGKYKSIIKPAIYKNGRQQKFSTAVLIKSDNIEDLELHSDLEWVEKEIDFYRGNFVGGKVNIDGFDEKINMISVYSPAWTTKQYRFNDIDTSEVRVSTQNEVWPIDILCRALKDTVKKDELWIIGGDFNSSETFDETWGSGNKEGFDRLRELGLKECLRDYTGKIVPTFRHSTGSFVHQLDHVFLSASVFNCLSDCRVGPAEEIFSNNTSDHLPIIADFKS